MHLSRISLIVLVALFTLNSCSPLFSNKRTLYSDAGGTIGSSTESDAEYEYYDFEESDSITLFQPYILEEFDTTFQSLIFDSLYQKATGISGEYRRLISTTAKNENVSIVIMGLLQNDDFEFQGEPTMAFFFKPKVFFVTEIKELDKKFVKTYNESVSDGYRLHSGNNYGLILEMAYSVNEGNLVCVIVKSSLKRRGLDAHWSDYPGPYSRSYFGKYYTDLIEKKLTTLYPIKHE